MRYHDRSYNAPVILCRFRSVASPPSQPVCTLNASVHVHKVCLNLPMVQTGTLRLGISKSRWRSNNMKLEICRLPPCGLSSWLFYLLTFSSLFLFFSFFIYLLAVVQVSRDKRRSKNTASEKRWKKKKKRKKEREAKESFFTSDLTYFLPLRALLM